MAGGRLPDWLEGIGARFKRETVSIEDPVPEEWKVILTLVDGAEQRKRIQGSWSKEAAGEPDAGAKSVPGKPSNDAPRHANSD